MNVDTYGNAFFSFLIGLALTSLISWGVSKVLGSEITSGVSSIASGGTAISTGINLLAFGPVGWITGSVLIIAGAGNIIFGTNEIVSGIVGSNSIRNIVGAEL